MTDRIMQDLAKLQTENRKYKEQVKGYVQKLLSRDEEIVKLKKQISDNELKECFTEKGWTMGTVTTLNERIKMITKLIGE